MGIRLIEELVENSDDSEFGDLKDSDEGPDLSFGRSPDLCYCIYAPDIRERRGAAFDRCPVCLFAWGSRCTIASFISWTVS